MKNLILLILTIASGFSQEFIPFFGNASGNYLLPDLVVALKSDEVSGSMLDASGNNRTFGITGSVGSEPGLVGGARTFSHLSGLTDYSARANEAAFTFGTTPFTITMWVFFTARSLAPNDMSLLGKGDYGSTEFSWWLWLDHGVSDDTMYFSFSSDGTYTFPDTSKELTFPIVGEIGSGYNFVVIRWDGTTLHLSVTHYSAAALEADQTKAFSGPFYNNSTSPVIIGANLGSSIHHLGGSVDEVFIWKRYVEDCQLQWLFTAKDGVFSYSNFDANTCVAP